MAELAADEARQCRGAGRGGVVCQLKSVFATCVGYAHLAQPPLPLLWARPPALPLGHAPSGPNEGMCQQPQVAPAAWVPGFPEQGCLWSRGLALWCPGTPWPWWLQRALHRLRAWKCVLPSGLGVLRIPDGNLQG